MKRTRLADVAREDILDFCEASGIAAAEIKIPEGTGAKNVHAAYCRVVKVLHKEGQCAITMDKGRVLMYDPRKVAR